MVMALVAKVHVDHATLMGSRWVHDKAHEFLNARIHAVLMLEGSFVPEALRLAREDILTPRITPQQPAD
jgi:hypothetical protein